MPELVTDQLRIYYESHGQGDPLILIRGLGSNADHWYAQVPELSQHYRVIIFDNRGIGRSSDPAGPFTIADMAADTLALMDGLGIEQAHILGLSMGGMIAQEIAIRRPQRLRGLMLVVTHCGGEHMVSPKKEVTETIGRMVEENSIEARVAALPVFFSRRTLMEKREVFEAYAGVSLKYPAGPEILKRQVAAIAQHDSYDRLPHIKAATLVLSCAEDVLIPPENSRILASQIPKAQLSILPEGGHQVMIETPQVCNAAIVQFLQQLDAAS